MKTQSEQLWEALGKLNEAIMLILTNALLLVLLVRVFADGVSMHIGWFSAIADASFAEQMAMAIAFRFIAGSFGRRG